MIVACRIARRRARRRGWSSRAVWLVAGHGVGDGHRVRSCPSPGPASRMARCVRDGLCRRIVCRRARRWPVAGSRAVGPVARSCVAMVRLVSATSVSLPCPRSGIPKARHLPCPGPTYACSRRRQPLCCVWFHMSIPWRSIDARPAARLRRIVGPPNQKPPQLARYSGILLVVSAGVDSSFGYERTRPTYQE